MPNYGGGSEPDYGGGNNTNYGNAQYNTSDGSDSPYGDYGTNDLGQPVDQYGEPLPNAGNGGWNWGSTWDNIVAASVGLLTGVFTGSIPAALAITALVNKGLNTNLAKEIVSQVQQGNISPSDAATTVAQQVQSAQNNDPTNQTDPLDSIQGDSDPTNPDFWTEYIDRFYGTDMSPSYEDMVLADAEFRRQSAQDLQNTIRQITMQRNNAATAAVGAYDSQIEGLLSQANAQSGIYNPVGFSFGGVTQTWTPRQGINLGSHISGMARDQLAADLGLGEYIGSNAEREALMNYGLAGVLSPQAGNLNFMQTLQDLALKEAGLQQGIDIANIQNESQDPSDLQTWSEVINTGSAAIDLWNKLFQDDEIS